MHHWIAESPHLLPSLPPLSNGIAAGCPFCKAREYQIPKIGQRLQFLVGGDVGQFGTRVDDKGYDLRADQFIVKMDYEIRGHLRNVTRFLDLYVVEPFSPAPAWMPQFSIQDVLALHESLLKGFVRFNSIDSGTSLHSLLYPLIGSAWQQRLPITGGDLWPMIEAHGIPHLHKSQFIFLFEFGFQLLVRSNGRQPVKRKKMPPLSKGRYLSDNARKLWIEHFGHD